MRRFGLNTWHVSDDDAVNAASESQWADERVSEVFRTVVAEVKAETAKAQHLVRKARLG